MDNMMGSGRGRQSSLTKLLEEKATLEQVLSDSEILTECKWGSQQLLTL